MRYVALLAFNKIVITHPDLVSQQEDVILECIDSPDITIRIQALELVQGMVTGDNLLSVVSRLMKQLRNSAPSKEGQDPKAPTEDEDSDDEAQVAVAGRTKIEAQMPVLPEDYRVDVIGRILHMCSKDNYANIVDFDWYIDVLTQLVRMAPTSRVVDAEQQSSLRAQADVSERIGDEIRNVAVKVRAMRATAVRASEIILAQQNADTPTGHSVSSRALKSVAWILGEYSIQIGQPEDALNSLLQLIPRTNIPEVITMALQAIAKIFSTIAGNDSEPWSSERKSKISLLMARIIHAYEPLMLHPNLEVQGRAVEFTELLKLTQEAASSQAASTDESEEDAPLLLTQAIPSLFNGWELNSVAPKAQLNVPGPEGIDLDEPIHANLNKLLSQADIVISEGAEVDEFEAYYNERPALTSISSHAAPAISRIADSQDEQVESYQSAAEESYLDPDIIARRKAERLERNKDDPFYIPSGGVPRTSTPIHNILQDSNGPDLDIDSIPIMQLDLERISTSAPQHRPQPRPRQKIIVTADETLESSDAGTPNRQYDSENNSDSFTKSKVKRLQKSLLKVDSSHIGSFNLEGESTDGFDPERQQREEVEMQQAMKEVERLRLEMQRANERIQVGQGVDIEGTAVVRKKKKAKKPTTAENEQPEGSEVISNTKKKKRKKKREGAEEGPKSEERDAEGEVVAAPEGGEGEVPIKTKKKKKKKVATEIEGG